MLKEEDMWDNKPEEESWQISHLMSADTFEIGNNAGKVTTGRMRIT